MFGLVWGPTLAAVSVVLDNATDGGAVRRALDCLLLAARMAAYHQVRQGGRAGADPNLHFLTGREGPGVVAKARAACCLRVCPLACRPTHAVLPPLAAHLLPACLPPAHPHRWTRWWTPSWLPSPSLAPCWPPPKAWRRTESRPRPAPRWRPCLPLPTSEGGVWQRGLLSAGQACCGEPPNPAAVLSEHSDGCCLRCCVMLRLSSHPPFPPPPAHPPTHAGPRAGPRRPTTPRAPTHTLTHRHPCPRPAPTSGPCRYGDWLRSGWRNVVDVALRLHRLDLLPTAVIAGKGRLNTQTEGPHGEPHGVPAWRQHILPRGHPLQQCLGSHQPGRCLAPPAGDGEDPEEARRRWPRPQSISKAKGSSGSLFSRAFTSLISIEGSDAATAEQVGLHHPRGWRSSQRHQGASVPFALARAVGAANCKTTGSVSQPAAPLGFLPCRRRSARQSWGRWQLPAWTRAT